MSKYVNKIFDKNRFSHQDRPISQYTRTISSNLTVLAIQKRSHLWHRITQYTGIPPEQSLQPYSKERYKAFRVRRGIDNNPIEPPHRTHRHHQFHQNNIYSLTVQSKTIQAFGVRRGIDSITRPPDRATNTTTNPDHP